MDEKPAGSAPPPMTQRDAIARAKGLPGERITGGDDPDLAATLEKERRWVRLLIVMIVAIVLAGFVLGALAVAVDSILGL